MVKVNNAYCLQHEKRPFRSSLCFWWARRTAYFCYAKALASGVASEKSKCVAFLRFRSAPTKREPYGFTIPSLPTRVKDIKYNPCGLFISFTLVGEEGLEPSRHCCHKILSLACLPVPPLARLVCIHLSIKSVFMLE